MMRSSWLLVLATMALGCSQAPLSEPPGTPADETAAEFDADYERHRKYADLLNADVIAVQEVDGEEALRRVFDDGTYDYHVASPNGVQLTGFAYRSTLSVTKDPDYVALDVGAVRVGTDLTVSVNEHPVRLLSVHLKSGCFDQPLTTSTTACTKLKAQLPILETWIYARAAANEPFLVLDDFNRRLKTGEAFYTLPQVKLQMKRV